VAFDKLLIKKYLSPIGFDATTFRSYLRPIYRVSRFSVI